jgi:dihydroorotate dehydrogenase (fumarate)
VLHTLRKGLEYWMRDHGFDSPGDFRGHLNLSRCSNPAAFERANYIRVLQNRRY